MSKRTVDALIVDDDPFSLSVLRDFFTDLEGTCAAALNGIDALEVLDKVQPRLLITDLNMPLLNGLDLIQKIKESCEVLPTFVMLTTDDSEVVRGRANEIGIDHFLTKPVDLDDLASIVFGT